MELTRLLAARTDEWKGICENFSRAGRAPASGGKTQQLGRILSDSFRDTGTAVAVVEDNKVVSRVNTEFERFPVFQGRSRRSEKLERIHSEWVPQNIGEPTSSRYEFPDPGMQVFKFVDKQNREKTVSMTAAQIRVPIESWYPDGCYQIQAGPGGIEPDHEAVHGIDG